MEPRAHHVLIGIFTLAIVGAALLFVLWLGKSYQNVDFRYYTVVFNEAVRGLSKGSAVQYSGIKIGDVDTLSLDPQNPNRVLARVRVEGNIPVKQDTRARLALTGITGNSVIELSGGSAASPPLTAPDGQDPVIVATPSPIAQLLANGDNLMSNLTELIVSAKSMLSPENAQHLTRALESLESVANAMASQKDDFNALLQAMTAASQEATTTLQHATTLIRNTDRLVDVQGRQTLDSARGAMASLDKTSASLNDIVQSNKAALAGGIRGLNEIGPALQELRSTLASIRKVMRRLEDNPSNYLLGREKIQEFQP